MSFPSFRCTAYNNESRERRDSGVEATISDKRRSVCNEELGIAYFEAEVLTQSYYYPFGMMMPDRQWSAGAEGHRYGFNGKESDSETGFLDYGFRIYYPAIGKFLSVDPLAPDYPWYTPYQFAGNRVIQAVDLDGLEPAILFGSKEQAVAIKNTEGNEIWVGVELVTLEGCVQVLDNHKKLGNKIKAVYLQTHGMPDRLFIRSGKDGIIDTKASTPGGVFNTDDKSVSSLDIDAFLSLSLKEQEESIKEGNDIFSAINQIREIGSMIEDGGTLILGGCLLAGGEDGDNLLISLGKLTGNRIKIAAAVDVVTNVTDGKILDTGRSGKFFKRGWKELDIKKADEEVLPEETEKDMKLKSKGVEVYSYE